MRGWTKKIHMYAGLASFTAFVVYGLAGLHASFRPAPPDRTPSPSRAEVVDFDIPAAMSDKELADHIFASLDMPLSGPIPDWALRRDGAGNLLLNFYTVNGNRRVTVLEAEGRLRIERERATTGGFVNALHATTISSPSRSRLVRAWAWYNQLAIWSLLLMVLSGVYLWLASRPGHRWGRLSFTAGTGLFLVLYWMTKR